MMESLLIFYFVDTHKLDYRADRYPTHELCMEAGHNRIIPGMNYPVCVGVEVKKKDVNP